MSGPYVTTTLSATVNLKPRQMDNNIYKHLKENVIQKLEGKCYRKYGYISKIYEILEYSKGKIVPENPMASALFGVKFSCRLCHPIKKRQIICRVQKITKLFMNASNGPITVIITKLNNKVFYQDPKSNKLFARIENEKSIEVTPGKYVKLTIESKSFSDMDHIIMAIGELISLATDQEIQKSFEEEHGSMVDKVTSFDKYITNEEDKELVEEEEADDKKDMTKQINNEEVLIKRQQIEKPKKLAELEDRREENEDNGKDNSDEPVEAEVEK